MGSKLSANDRTRAVNVPPYWGSPNLSHQCAGAADVVCVVVTGAGALVVAGAGAAVSVGLAQAATIDIVPRTRVKIMKQVHIFTIVFLFIIYYLPH